MCSVHSCSEERAGGGEVAGRVNSTAERISSAEPHNLGKDSKIGRRILVCRNPSKPINSGEISKLKHCDLAVKLNMAFQVPVSPPTCACNTQQFRFVYTREFQV